MYLLTQYIVYVSVPHTLLEICTVAIAIIIIIINQVLRIIQIAVKSDIKTGRIYISLYYLLAHVYVYVFVVMFCMYVLLCKYGFNVVICILLWCGRMVFAKHQS